MPNLYDICASCGEKFGRHSARSKSCPDAGGEYKAGTTFTALPLPPKTVWLVTSGSYSDYSVYAVCETEALAKDLAELDTKLGLAHSLNDPVEMKLYDSIPPVIEYASREATWGPNKDTPEVKRYDAKYRTWAGKDFEIMDDPQPLSKPRFLRVEGTDPEKVDKVFADRVAQIMAERMGIA